LSVIKNEERKEKDFMVNLILVLMRKKEKENFISLFLQKLMWFF
jgi:hypothetical protein